MNDPTIALEIIERFIARQSSRKHGQAAALRSVQGLRARLMADDRIMDAVFNDHLRPLIEAIEAAAAIDPDIRQQAATLRAAIADAGFDLDNYPTRVYESTPVQEVTIPARDDHAGQPENALTVSLYWICPNCGGPRGETREGFSRDGTHVLTVSRWTNPCRHTDQYPAVREEARTNGLNPKE